MSKDLPGSILFLIPSSPAISIAAKVRYGFPEASGNLISHLAPFLLRVIGIRHDADLYALSEKQVKKVPTVCGSLREAMEALDKDRSFLTQGNVFTDDQIDAYIELKYEEIHNFEHTPHPIEFDMYYSC